MLVTFLRTVHCDLVLIIWAVGGVATVWGLVALLRRQTMSRPLRILLAVTAGIGALQALVGGGLFLSGQRPIDQLHYVYGLIVLIAIPIAYTYAGDKADADARERRRDLIIYIIAVAVVVAAAVRAAMTGGVCR
jgi:heme A synthase